MSNPNESVSSLDDGDDLDHIAALRQKPPFVPVDSDKAAKRDALVNLDRAPSRHIINNNNSTDDDGRLYYPNDDNHNPPDDTVTDVSVFQPPDASPVDAVIHTMRTAFEDFSEKVNRFEANLESEQQRAEADAAAEIARAQATLQTVSRCVELFERRVEMLLLSRVFCRWQRQTELKRVCWAKATKILKKTGAIVRCKRLLLRWHIIARSISLARQERVVQWQYGLRKLATVYAFSHEKLQRRCVRAHLMMG